MRSGIRLINAVCLRPRADRPNRWLAIRHQTWERTLSRTDGVNHTFQLLTEAGTTYSEMRNDLRAR
jgi:hypothetical protein